MSGARDEQLVALYRKTGDQKYFEEIHNRYRDQLERFLSKYLTNRPLVDHEGIINSTFVAFHEFCLSDKPIHPVRAQLFQGVRMRALDAIRFVKRAKRGSGLKRVNLSTCLLDPADMPDQMAERNDAASLLQTAVSKLPPEEEQAVRMVYLVGCTLEDAAKRLGVSLATIKRRIRSGLDSLQTLANLEILAAD